MTTAVLSATACLHEVFESQVDANPDAIALVCGDEVFTYAELDQRTNQLARYLRAHWAGPGKLIGIYFHRSEKPILAILAILKAGGAYVPLDPAFPIERIRHIVADAEIGMVVTDQSLADEAAEWFDGPCISVDCDATDIDRHSTDRLSRDQSQVSPEDLSYVLFTSGTTGRPKGIMTEHRNVAQFAESFNEVIQLTPDDNVYQGFALGFDGSVEEIWMAFSNGATLVVGTADAAQLGHEAARIFAEHNITVFSTVPTCLNLIHDELPTVRLIIVSGEACPPELVDRWAKPERRMLNVYGPTETTVNSTVAECVPGKPITIGRALRGYELHILDANMEPVPHGESGELYIGGVGVARGYLNQPEMTAKHFLPNTLGGALNDHSDDTLANSLDDTVVGTLAGTLSSVESESRLYRTGDLVQYDDDGELLFHGRIDRQVKIRGFRIELSEIESVLREHAQIDQAVVNVYEHDGRKELAAYIVTPNVNGSLDRAGIQQLLNDRLTSYMVPSYLDQLDALPMTSSGKVDRKNLPTPRETLVARDREIVAPRNELEQTITSVWESILKTSPISVEDDFFTDLAGYSLLAAEMVTKLRQQHGCEVAIRDVYNHPTVEQLAARVAPALEKRSHESGNKPARRTSREVFQSVWTITRWTCVALQAVSLVLMSSVMSVPAVLMILISMAALRGTIGVNAYIWTLAGVVFAAPLLGILLAVSVKWTVIGRYKPGRYPVWGIYYFRWWLANRVQFLTWTELYAGTPLMSFYFRLMGARVGKNCILDTSGGAIFDLLTIGDDTCIGAESQLLGYRVEDGELIIGSIDIGSRCFVGTQSSFGINTRMADDSYLDDQSLLPDGTVMEAGEARRGSPAEPAPVKIPEVSEEDAYRRHPFLFGLLQFIASEVVGEVFVLGLAIPMMILARIGYGLQGYVGAAAAVTLGLPLAILFFCLFVAAIKRVILPKTVPGVYKVESWFYLRRWSTDCLVRISSGLLYPVYSTIYLPTWLRLMGARIGRRTEVSTVANMLPDLVEIGSESFFADGSIVGGRRLFRGHVHLARNRIGARSFVGNSAVLPVGTDLGDDCLIGVLSVPPAVNGCPRVQDNSEWLGSPPFRLPNRQKVESFHTSTTYKPTFRLYVLRYLVDGVRVLLPYYIMAFLMVLFTVGVLVSQIHLPLWATFALAGPATLLLSAVAGLIVVGVKELLMGTFKPEVKPLWCLYVWLNEVVNGVYETIGASVLSPLMGTPFIGWYLRLMGCKVGKHTFIETDLFSEFDLVDIGDYAALNSGVIVQNHLFEDRVMKSSHLRIGDECSVGNNSVVLYDTRMETGSSIGPMSLLMKGESLAAGTRWLGIPTSQID
jgi:non-ribosomal peptide synthetase-like protein